MVSYLNSNSLAEYSSEVLSASGNAELEQRLGLYRVFLKLYEHHRCLLDEILELENADARWAPRKALHFIQGVVQGEQTYLVTNLLKDQTQILRQSQAIWLIGRDRKAALPIQDRRLSRRHAVIQHVTGEGFCLIDLNSTNGSFVNGEPVRLARSLKDGDQVRLGSLTFTFFICHGAKEVDDVAPDLMAQIQAIRKAATQTSGERSPELDLPTAEIGWDTPLPNGAEETSMFLIPAIADNELLPEKLSEISPLKQAEILDRFLNR